MKILLLGSGGREHALAWKIAQSAKCEKLFIAPGNAGTVNAGENVNIGVNEFDKIKQFGELRSKHKDAEVANEKKRWFGYVKDHYFKDGYLYKKGIDKLKALGAQDELDEISRWEPLPEK